MLKIFRIALMLVASVAIFSSCEKETSVENGVPGEFPVAVVEQAVLEQKLMGCSGLLTAAGPQQLWMI